MDTPFFNFFFLCVCFCFPCVLCASRSPGATEKSTQHEDELYIESAPLAEILSKMCQTLPNSPKNLHRLVNSPRNFAPPKKLHNFKKTFRLYHVTSPQTSVQFTLKLKSGLPNLARISSVDIVGINQNFVGIPGTASIFTRWNGK